MTTFNATEYANGLSVKNLNADLASGAVTKAQALAACKAKLARENIRKGALARWTRVAESLADKSVDGIDSDYAFTGKRADEPKADAPTKAEPDHVERMHALVSKRIMSNADKAELGNLIATYVTR